MALSVDPLTYIITVPKADLTLIQSVPTEIRELNLNTFRLNLKAWEDDQYGIVKYKTHTHNTEVSLGGLTYARVIELLSPYTVTFEDGTYAVNLVGANSNVGDRVNVNQVSVRSANSAGLISTPLIEFSSFEGGIWVDSSSSTSGTLFPSGTRLAPVNNLSDAKAIANLRGFTNIYIIGSITINSGLDYSGFIFSGQSDVTSEAVIDSAANVTNCVFKDVTISGTLDGGNEINSCTVGNITYVNGSLIKCGLTGTITLGGSEDAILVNCYQDGTTSPEVNMGGSGQNLSVTEYSGTLNISNFSGFGNVAAIGMSEGRVILDSTITAGGIVLSGVGLYENNSTNTTFLTDSGLISKEAIVKASWESVHIDVTYGTSGTTFPIGTAELPVNNEADAYIIANNNLIREYHIRGTILLSENYINWTFKGIGAVQSDIISINSKDVTNSYFERITLTGTFAGTNMQYYECIMSNVSNLVGLMYSVGLTGSISMPSTVGNILLGTNLSAIDNPTNVDLNGINVAQLSFDSGDLNYLNLNAGGILSHSGHIGSVILDSSCTGGSVSVSGTLKFTNNSSATVDISNLIDVDFYDMISKLKINAYNKITRAGDILTLYADDNVTPYATIDLSNDEREITIL